MTTTRTLTRCAAAAAVAGASLLGATAPVAAESQTHRDARGDVRLLTPTPAAAPADVDIVGGENVFRGRTLTMSLSFDGLQREGYAAQWRIRSADADYVLTYDVRGLEPLIIFESSAELAARRGQADVGVPTCRGVAVGRAGAVLTGTVPLRCLDGADEVRIAAASGEELEDGRRRLDDARRRGLADDPSRLRYGPPLARG